MLHQTAIGFEDVAHGLRSLAGALDAARADHGHSMLLLAATPLLTVADLLGGGARSGEALASARTRAAVEFDRLTGAARQVAVRAAAVAPTAPVPSRTLAPGGGAGSGWADQADSQSADALATEAAEAVRIDDPGWLLAVCQELGTHRDDPVYAAEFFGRLGAAATRRFVEHVHDFGNAGPWNPGAWPGDRDRDFLAPFDEALATATRSSGWDHQFIWDLFGGEGVGNDHDADVTVDLLRHGVYSVDALVTAGQHVLMARVVWYSTNWLAAGVRSGPVVLDAIGRNPAAAQEFLSMADLFDDVDTSPQTNLQVLLGATYKDRWGDDGRALGHLLEVATLQGPDPGDSARLVQGMVRAVSTQVRRSEVELSDPMRESMARIVMGGHNVDALAHSALSDHDTYDDPLVSAGFLVPRLRQDDLGVFLGEVMQSPRATETLLAGSAAYLRAQLSDAGDGQPRSAGALLGLLYRSHRDAMEQASSGGDILAALTNIVGVAGPEGRLAKANIQGARSFLEMVSSGRSRPPSGYGFQARVQDAMDAVYVESLYAQGLTTRPPDTSLVNPKQVAGSPLKPFDRMKKTDKAAYWDWVFDNAQTGHGHGDDWDGAWKGFHEQAERDPAG